MSAPKPSRPRPSQRPERTIPERATLDGLEATWSDRWAEDNTFRFEQPEDRGEVFAIDTPPPTVSGNLHLGHVFSYTHTDCVARFQRMAGKAVFYPMGWDDNGVPTERRVENYYGVRCDPTVPFAEDFNPPETPAKERRDYLPVGRQNFIELCERLSQEDEQVFEALWRRLGLSVDWSHTYTTIGERARRASQRAFLRNLARGEAYQADAPCLWDVTFQMAVSQAELEDRERPGAYHDVGFVRPDGTEIIISTTRPELIVSCVALVAHPEDQRYQALFGTSVTSPIFDVSVPVLAHPLADPEKGTGVAMICTFGDLTDVIWWRELDLPARAVIERDGRFRADTPEWLETPEAADRYAEIAGKYPKQVRRIMAEWLEASGALKGAPKQITHPVKFYEKGDEPLEIVQSRQWYIRNGGRDANLRAELISRGDQVKWHPPYMQARYTNWIEGLNGDWLISRQRYFGVPIPVWYRVNEDGSYDQDAPIVPAEADLPVDPQADVPAGYTADQRNQPGGFTGDPDIMDTWATSSLTPNIACGWEEDADLFAVTFPMDLRPQGHDIIRTWLFSTMLRSDLEFDTAPWAHASLSGWILDPDRKKMSKSKGNVVVPTDLLDRHGADALRYWAANGRPGIDTATDEGVMKVGRRLAIKVLNASRFVLGLGAPAGTEPITEPIDMVLLARLRDLVESATAAFEAFDYARALERTEAFFWEFCDDYLELVKVRAYGEGPQASSARAALEVALSTLLRLFAPFLPFATEEVWSWWMEGSIHLSSWPTTREIDEHLGSAEPDIAIAGTASRVLAEMRKAKTESKRGMKTRIEVVQLRCSAEEAQHVELVRADLSAAGGVDNWEITAADEFAMSVRLEPAPTNP